jgi:hypothetical protein
MGGGGLVLLKRPRVPDDEGKRTDLSTRRSVMDQAGVSYCCRHTVPLFSYFFYSACVFDPWDVETDALFCCICIISGPNGNVMPLALRDQHKSA